MIASILASFAGVLVFLFIFWKRLKEDYSSEIIFKTAANILLGMLIGWAISFKFISNASFWLETLGLIAGLAFSVYRYRIRLYETLDALVVSVLPWLSFFFLKDSVTTSSLSSFIAFLVVLIFVFIFYYLDLHYKSYTWYKSGKIGFSGLVTTGLFFLIRSAIAISRLPVVSFLSGFEGIISGIAAFVCFLLVFNLSRKA